MSLGLGDGQVKSWRRPEAEINFEISLAKYPAPVFGRAAIQEESTVPGTKTDRNLCRVSLLIVLSCSCDGGRGGSSSKDAAAVSEEAHRKTHAEILESQSERQRPWQVRHDVSHMGQRSCQQTTKSMQ